MCLGNIYYIGKKIDTTCAYEIHKIVGNATNHGKCWLQENSLHKVG